MVVEVGVEVIEEVDNWARDLQVSWHRSSKRAAFETVVVVAAAGSHTSCAVAFEVER